MNRSGQTGNAILIIGEPMVELSGIDMTGGQAGIGFAGDTLNTAVYLTRALGKARPIDYLTVLGTDRFSAGMIGWMQAEGIGTHRIGRHPDRLPGIYAIEVDDRGERSFHYWREQSAARTLFDDGMPVDDALADAAVVYLSGITLAILSEAARSRLIEACRRLKAAGRVVVFDSNHRPRLWQGDDQARAAFAAMWQATTIGLPSADDEARLYPGETPHEILERIAACGVGEIVLKRGAAKPLLWQGGQVRAIATRPATNVVDTTAAGDSFNAGYLHARLTGAAPEKAVLAGHALATRVIAHPGAIMPRGG